MYKLYYDHHRREEVVLSNILQTQMESKVCLLFEDIVIVTDQSVMMLGVYLVGVFEQDALVQNGQ